MLAPGIQDIIPPGHNPRTKFPAVDRLIETYKTLPKLHKTLIAGEWLQAYNIVPAFFFSCNSNSTNWKRWKLTQLTSLPKVIWEESCVAALSHTYAVKSPLVTMARLKFVRKSTPSRGWIPKSRYLPRPWTRPTYDAKRYPDPIRRFFTMHWTDRRTDRQIVHGKVWSLYAAALRERRVLIITS